METFLEAAHIPPFWKRLNVVKIQLIDMAMTQWKSEEAKLDGPIA